MAGVVLAWVNGTALDYAGWSTASMAIAILITRIASRFSGIQFPQAWSVLTIGALLATASAWAFKSDPRWSIAIAAMAMSLTAIAVLMTSERDKIRFSSFACFMVANVAGILFAIRELFEINGSSACIGLLSVSSAVTLAMGWRSGKARYVVGSMAVAQFAGLVFCNYQLARGSVFEFGTHFILLQIAISATLCIASSILGFGAFVRPTVSLNVVCLTLLSLGWYGISLSTDLDSFGPVVYFVAIVLTFGACLTGVWFRESRWGLDVDLLVYLTGICGVVCLMQCLDPDPTQLLWTSTLIFAAYCLLSSFLWRASDRIRECVNKLGLLRLIEPMPAAIEVVFANTLMAMLVAALGLMAQFSCESQSLRFVSSQAIFAAGIAVGFLARYQDMRMITFAAMNGFKDDSVHWSLNGAGTLRIIALVLGVAAATAFGWHFCDISVTKPTSRLALLGLSLAIVGAIYGFGLVKWVGMKLDWQAAALRLMPSLVIAATSCVLVCLYAESRGPFATNISNVAIVLTLVISGLLCLAAALLPGQDPFDLSEKGRTTYIYAIELLLVLLVVHMRIVFPWLFSGWVQRVWPLVVVCLSFAGLAASEYARRRRVAVLEVPLRRTGALLPLMPVLAYWVLPSDISYGASLLSATFAYASFGYLRKSTLYWGVSILFANASLWTILQDFRFSFVQHPQLWVIPPALCVLVIVQIMRQQMARTQITAARYMATTSIYVSSTAELFLHGISEAPWMPIVLACISIVGILFGIGARIRALLWLGMLFLCVAMFSIVWHAAVDLDQTWVWYATGIVMGVFILGVFAMFEKRRESLKRLVSTIQTWDD